MHILNSVSRNIARCIACPLLKSTEDEVGWDSKGSTCKIVARSNPTSAALHETISPCSRTNIVYNVASYGRALKK